MTSLRSDPAEIARTIGTLFRAGDVVEMRVPKTERGVLSGYFNDTDALVKALAAPNGDFPSVYISLNPINPALLARAANRIKHHAKVTTSDKDVEHRRWLLVDCDALRPAEISSTDIEHDAALELARRIRFELGEENWPAPVLADSGNGGHLLYPVDLPNDEESAKLIENVLKALAIRFDNGTVKIDQTVFNAARVTKAYGTIARKGDHIDERPHRLSRILDVPNTLVPVSRELLEKVAAKAAPIPETPRNTGARAGRRFDLEGFIARHLSARAPQPHEGGRKWILESCPFDETHTAPDSAIFERADGSLAFKCFHNSCACKHWADVRERFEGPRPKQRPAENQQSSRSTTGKPVPPKLIGYKALLDIQTEVGQMLFDGFPLPAKGATLKVGASRSGKTLLAVQEALAITSGRALFDYYQVKQQGAVMIVEVDDPAGAAGIKQIVELFDAKHELPLYVVEKVPFSFGPALLDWLREQITKLDLRLTVLDSFTALRGPRPPGVDIVKVEANELGQLDALGKEVGSAIEIIHHESKGAAGLDWTQLGAGTFAMQMSVEGMIQVSRFRDLDGPERLVRMRARRHPNDVQMVLRFRKDTLDHEHVLEGSAAELYPVMKQIQADIGTELFGIKELAQATGNSRAHAYRVIDRLRYAGVIEKLDRGQYKLVAKI